MNGPERVVRPWTCMGCGKYLVGGGCTCSREQKKAAGITNDPEWKLPQGSWISTRDRLPEIGQECLIFKSGINSGMFVSKFESRDVYANDLVPYGWRGPGMFIFFAQEIEWWMPVPPEPGSGE